ncbi:hypothetical protein [Cryobacterium lyxosi]|uniref:Uncharacterized protein n=1 Tax=Cryobacterium lyxosi TaxID=1259228 RepID=A0A4V3IPL4_9MICO|nr:hypothetical protein [Cryobacterium lyxosi]TFD28831.1 hypothetical protein E3T27_02825 [Cryobacterium lyxosi]
MMVASHRGLRLCRPSSANSITSTSMLLVYGKLGDHRHSNARFSRRVGAVGGWLGSYGGEDSPGDISRFPR